MGLRTARFDPAAPTSREPAVVALGDFETMSVSDAALLAAAAREAQDLALPLLAVALRPDQPSSVVTDAERDALLDAAGVDTAILVPVDERVRTTPAENFTDAVLLRVARPRVLFVLRDFRFGLENSGDAETLRTYGLVREFDVRQIAPAQLGGQPVTARRVRDAAASANPALVEELLGRAWRRPSAASAVTTSLGEPTPASSEADDLGTAFELEDALEGDDASDEESVAADADEYADDLAEEQAADIGILDDPEFLDDGTPVVSDPEALAAAEAAVAAAPSLEDMRVASAGRDLTQGWIAYGDSKQRDVSAAADEDESDSDDDAAPWNPDAVGDARQVRIPFAAVVFVAALVLAAISRGCSHG